MTTRKAEIEKIHAAVCNFMDTLEAIDLDVLTESDKKVITKLAEDACIFALYRKLTE